MITTEERSLDSIWSELTDRIGRVVRETHATDAFHDIVKKSVFDWVKSPEGPRSKLVGKSFSMEEEKEVNEFCDWIAEIFVSTIRHADKKAKSVGLDHSAMQTVS